MFIAVVFGYIMATVMAFCGLCSVFAFMQTDLQSLGAMRVMSGLAVAAWPLAVAVIIFSLVQIAISLEKIVIYNTMAGAPAPSAPPPPPQPVNKKQDAKFTPPKPMEGSFFHIDPDSVPPPSPPQDYAQAPDNMQLEDIARLARQTDNERSATEGRREHAAAPQDPNTPPPPPVQAEKRPSNGLSFFRVD